MRRPKFEEAGHGRNGIEILAAFGELNEELLHVEAMPIPEVSEAPSSMEPYVFAIRHQHARLQCVGKVGRDHFGENLIAEHGVAQTEDHLDALVDIALHPIGAAEKHFRLAGVAENEDAAVLEKAPDDAAHANPAAEPA